MSTFNRKRQINKAISELESQEPVSHQKWCASLTQLLLSMPPQPAPCNCHLPQRTWVGLTADEYAELAEEYGPFPINQIEAKLKKKNT